MEFASFLFSTNSSSIGLLSNNDSNSEGGLLSNTNITECSLLTGTANGCGVDAFSGKDFFGTPDFTNMDVNFFANVGDIDTAGSVAYGNVETVGSVASVGVETVGSVACGGFDAGSSCDGGFSSMC